MNLLDELNITLSADPAGDGGISREDLLSGKAKIKLENGNTVGGEDTEEEDDLYEETDLDEEFEDDSEEDTDNDSEEEEVVSKADYDKVEKDLAAARKETRHLKRIIKDNGIDTKTGTKLNPEDGPSAREVSRFNRAVRSELKLKGFDEKVARLLIHEFDIDEDVDDDYITDRAEELAADYSDFVKKADTKRKPRSDAGITRPNTQKKKLNPAAERMINAGYSVRL